MGFLLCNGKLAVASDPYPREAILSKAHKSQFMIHPESTQMYYDQIRHYSWKEMQRDIATFVAKCMTC